MNSRPAAIAVLGLVSVLLAACSAGAANQSWPGLALKGDMGYLAHNHFVSAVNLATGQKAWQYPEKADTKLLFYADPLLDSKGDLVAATYNGSVFKLDPASGALKWKHDGDGGKIIAPLAEAPGGDYYASSESGDLLIFDSATGALKTKIHLGKAFAWGAMAADAQRLYVATIEHEVYAVNFQSGKTDWSLDVGGSIAGGITLAEGKLYVGTFAGKVIALDAQSGQTLWDAKADGWVWQAPVAAGDSVFAADLSGTLRALSPSDGAPQWNQKLGAPLQAAPAVDGGLVFIGTTAGTVRAYSAADGAQKWEQTLEGGVFGTLRVFGGKLLITVNGSKYQLAALAPDTGSIAWTYVEPA
ncbi:MAG: PQQ-binding-like beta-propeller repeat protein [Anaerolineales bacterium]